VSKRINAPLVSTRNPIHEIGLASVARTVTESSTSTRAATLCETSGFVTSFAADWIVTVTTLLKPRRPAESSAKPTMLNVPVAGTTVSVSTNSTESASGAVYTIESLGGVVGSLTDERGATRKPTFAMPVFWTAWMSTAMPPPCDASAPDVGEISVTRSAWTLFRKMKSVSSEKLPAPSVARPMIVMPPPAPELAEKVIVRLTA